jgi:hypothetical protein
MIGLVHLIRAVNGQEPFARFLDSHRAHRPGAEHDLVLVLKGFPSHQAAAPYLSMADDLSPETIFLPDRGFDLAAYGEAARRLGHERVCFLNSYSVILVDGWLGRLTDALEQPDVGLVGASASWESQAEWMRGRARHWPQQLVGLPGARRDYPRFPNPHIRTSAFMLDRLALLNMGLERAADKRASYLLESGWQSITRRLQEQDLRAAVVGRDGKTYDVEEWPGSHTFRSGDQENLLVADNQTQSYQMASSRRRRRLARDSWSAPGGFWTRRSQASIE